MSALRDILQHMTRQTWFRILDLPTPEAPMTTSLTVRITIVSRSVHGQQKEKEFVVVVVEEQARLVSGASEIVISRANILHLLLQ